MTLDNELAISAPIGVTGNKMSRKEVHDRMRYTMLTATDFNKAPVFRLSINMGSEPYIMGFNMAKGSIAKSLRAVADIMDETKAEDFMELMDSAVEPQFVQDSSGFISDPIGTWQFDYSNLYSLMVDPEFPKLKIDGTSYTKE